MIIATDRAAIVTNRMISVMITELSCQLTGEFGLMDRDFFT
jgi:hypothetical protein